MKKLKLRTPHKEGEVFIEWGKRKKNMERISEGWNS